MREQHRISFSRSRVLDRASGESEVTIHLDGIDVGAIRKEVVDATGRMGWHAHWMASGYDVTFWVGVNQHRPPVNAWFPVDDYGPGTTTVERRSRARRALAAAKLYASEGWK